MPSPPTPHRRPPARRVILDAAEALLLEGGSQGLSMRLLARRSGYTAPTIYHHFGDKTGLIDEVLEQRFKRLLARLRRVPRGGDPVAYLRALASAFIRFGLENPEHYILLTSPRSTSAAPLPSAEAAQDLVTEAFENLAAEGALATDDLEGASQAAWALLHGLISLRISRPAYPWARSLTEVALRMIECGLVKTEARAG